MCALSPWAIVAVILMLASDRPSNAVWWLVGWTLSTFAVGVVIVFFFGGYDFSKAGTPSTAAAIVQVALGVLLLVAASRFWARRPARTGKLPKEPGWMTRIGKMRPIWAFLIGAFWINTTLVVAAAVDTLRANLSNSDSIVVFAAFALVTASVQGALILYAYALPEPRIDRARPNPGVDHAEPGSGARGRRVRARGLARRQGHPRPDGVERPACSSPRPTWRARHTTACPP